MKVLLKYKLLLLCTFFMLSVLAVVGVLSYRNGAVLKKELYEVSEEILHAQLDRMAMDVYELCRMTHEFFQNEIEHAFHAFLDLANNTEPSKPQYLEETFKIPFAVGKLAAQKHIWQPINQTDPLHVLPEMSLPSLVIGQTVLGADTKIFEAFFEKASSKRNIDITIFQRINAAGDMLRVATTLENNEGETALGRYMPAYYSKGAPNSIVQDILNKETYHGRFLLFDSWYIAAYKPILSEEGSVLGMLFIGIKNPSLKSLYKAMSRMRIGEKGYVWALYGGGRPYAGRIGEYAATQESSRQGVSPYDSIDANGVYFIREICKEAVTLMPYETKSRLVALSRIGEKSPKYKRSHYTYFEPWDWVIGAQVQEEPALYNHASIDAAFYAFLKKTLSGIGLGFICLLLLAFILLSHFLRHVGWIHRICRHFTRVSSSVLLNQFTPEMEKHLNPKNRIRLVYDEVYDSLGQLKRVAQDIDKQASFLNAIKLKIRDSNERLQLVCSQQKMFLKGLQESSDILEPQVQNVSIHGKQIVKNALHFSGNLNNLNNEMGAKRIRLKEMHAMLDQLKQATSGVASRLAIISEKANKLNGVVTTINKVADQAHLLSLNAAIEADKNLDKGSGLSVVADEVASLSDRTSMATIDTEQVIDEMQLSISFGIKEIDSFMKKLNADIINIERMFIEQGELFRAFSRLNERFGDVVDQLIHHADQISKTVEEATQLGRAVTQTMGLLEDFYSISSQFKETQIQLEKQYQVLR